MNHLPEKAYKNAEFLNSPAARQIRIVCEMEEPRVRFKEEGVENTIVFFGSARIHSAETSKANLEKVQSRIAAEGEYEGSARDLHKAEAGVRLVKYYDQTRELARRFTKWSMEREERSYYICSGGGPGIMEASNRGAADVPGGKSVGLGISLPFEQGVNQWVTPELAFEFHYFFTRKYWFLYLCKGLVVFPGGFGTMDELFETLTLVQTGKIRKKLPVVLFGKAYWDKILNLEAMADFGTISPGDTDLFYTTDDVDDAFNYLTAELDSVTQSF